MSDVKVVIPNWNGQASLAACLDSLLAQKKAADVIVVDNGSTDDSIRLVQDKYPGVELIINTKNLGFAGGVNVGIKKAMAESAKYVALFNNDAIADKDWLLNLIESIEKNPKIGIVTSKLLSSDGKSLDSSGDFYTNWGLPFPRGRGETDINKYDQQTKIFAGSGGASLYRVSMLQKIGLFDEDFFAYYEDIDLSFRAQLAGWQIIYAPRAIAYHQIGATGQRIKGFTTYQTIKNLPWLFWKNVPTRYLFTIGWRFKLAYISFIASAVARGHFWSVLKGLVVSVLFSPKKLIQRFQIQRQKTVNNEYIWNLFVLDLPPNAYKLRRLRSVWWKLLRKT